MIAIGTPYCTDAAHRADVAGDAGDQVAGAGALDPAERQPQDGADDVLAGGGQQVLAEQRRGALGDEREQRLRAHTTATTSQASASRPAPVPVDGRGRPASPSSARHDQPGAGGERVEHDQRDEDRRAARAISSPKKPQHGAVVGDRPAALAGCASRRRPARRSRGAGGGAAASGEPLADGRRPGRQRAAAGRRPAGRPCGRTRSRRRWSSSVGGHRAASTLARRTAAGHDVRGRPGRRPAAPSWRPSVTTRSPLEQDDAVGVVEPQRRHGA